MMSFADSLRSIQPRDERKERLDRLVHSYVAISRDHCRLAAQDVQRQIFAYVSLDCYGGYWRKDLPMHHGTAEQRAAARKKCAEKSYSKNGYGTTKSAPLRYGLEIYDKHEAQIAADMVSSELKKLGFTNYRVQVVEFHNVICVSRVNSFTGTEHITYQEVPGIYYYLHIAIRW